MPLFLFLNIFARNLSVARNLSEEMLDALVVLNKFVCCDYKYNYVGEFLEEFSTDN
jgi:hypothetical protein